MEKGSPPVRGFLDLQLSHEVASVAPDPSRWASPPQLQFHLRRALGVTSDRGIQLPGSPLGFDCLQYSTVQKKNADSPRTHLGIGLHQQKRVLVRLCCMHTDPTFHCSLGDRQARRKA